MSYSLQELAYFFFPLLNVHSDFQDFVYANYRDIHDVKELAEKANMSLSTFTRRFKDTFNDTAQNWLTARRAESVLYDIVKTGLTFTEIAEKHEFSSSAYLTFFCKQHFGKTPATLRKNWKKGDIDIKS
ncbi:transcriptional regulator, AraC family [gut metagenome]|uniref:Transcriptional regulator, AraC family n=1 Tax=gut metagenome TaxID=749906 RepID=J9FZU7_9ZZZZ